MTPVTIRGTQMVTKVPSPAEGEACIPLHAIIRKVRYHILMKNSTLHRKITRHLGLFVAIGLLLAACAPAAAPGCGDGLCSSLEDGETCPQDCARTGLVRKTLTTSIDVEGIGNIAILIAYPNQGRFPEGTGVVVTVSSFYATQQGFVTSPDFTAVGLIQVSYLWPGTMDEAFVMQSEGTNDFGGEKSLLALRDVIRFATGRLRDVNDRALMSLVPMTPMVDEVGLYAFDGAGIAAVNVLARYGDALPGVAWFVGHENPTVDTLSCLEAGYYDENNLALRNPLYVFPTNYSPVGITLNYSNLRWDAAYTDPLRGFSGRPYLDLDGNAAPGEADYFFGAPVPEMFTRRYYSTALTQALLDNQVFSWADWPSDLATPQEAAEAWAARQSTSRYLDLSLAAPNLKVMLVFSSRDHIQAALDKPHIHQAFQGFRFVAQLRWVRLNPDRAYLQQLSAVSGTDLPDNPANTEPEDWLNIVDWAYPSSGLVEQMAPLAAVSEMADRAHTGRWDENLGATLYDFNK